MFNYKANGIVWGNLWGGGPGRYRANNLSADSLEALIKLIDAGVVNGSLDSGMGFESLVGAIMNIDVIETRQIDGKTFVAIESEQYISGDISDDIADFLYEV